MRRNGSPGHMVAQLPELVPSAPAERRPPGPAAAIRRDRPPRGETIIACSAAGEHLDAVRVGNMSGTS